MSKRSSIIVTLRGRSIARIVSLEENPVSLFGYGGDGHVRTTKL